MVFVGRSWYDSWWWDPGCLGICVNGYGILDGSYGREEEMDAGSSVFVKFNRKLHGKKVHKGRKQDTLTINFLKKYIHYAKHRVQPELSNEASEQIANAYAELRNANSNAKVGGGGGSGRGVALFLLLLEH